jgi:hypothetical protein
VLAPELARVVAPELALAQGVAGLELDQVAVALGPVPVVVELGLVPAAAVLEQSPVAVALPLGRVEVALGLDPVVVELGQNPVAAELELAQVAAAPKIKSVTAAHHHGLVPLRLAAEDSAVAAETMRVPAAIEAAEAWAAADTAVVAGEDAAAVE